jgi:hypothetical protein
MVLEPFPASVFTQPAMVAVPLTVIFEKLLLLLLITLPIAEVAVELVTSQSTTAEALLRTKVPTMELLLTS